jgi:hypothetical protein
MITQHQEINVDTVRCRFTVSTWFSVTTLSVSRYFFIGNLNNQRKITKKKEDLPVHPMHICVLRNNLP